MAWTTPLTAVSNATLTAAQWNASVRDNFAETAPAKATTSGRFFASTGANTIAERIPTASTVSANQTTTSTSYTNLTTVGPTVSTLATGTHALVSWNAHTENDTTGANSYSSYAISGATTVASNDGWGLGHSVSAAGRIVAAGRVRLENSLTAGNNTFTQQYRVSGGTGGWSNRHMAVLPF